MAHAQAISRRVRFSIPAGRARRLRVPLTGRGYRILRRNVARANADSELDGAFVVLDARTDDGERFPGEAKHDGVLFLARGPKVEPRKGSSPAVRRVYADYGRDGAGAITRVCCHVPHLSSPRALWDFAAHRRPVAARQRGDGTAAI